MARKPRGDVFAALAGDILESQSEREAIEVALARQEIIALCGKHPWNMLTAVDVDGTPIIRTKDEADENSPFKGWPAEKLYLKAIIDALFGKWRVVLVEKSRQMMMSTVVMLCAYWLASFREGRAILVSKQTEEESLELVEAKIVGTYLRTPQWWKDAVPMVVGRRTTGNISAPKRLVFPKTDSMIRAVKQNAAVRAFRGGTTSLGVIDEAAFQEEFPAMIQALGPAATRIWAITTANTGNPGAEKFAEMVSDGLGSVVDLSAEDPDAAR
jgi:hypothetical protein